MKIDENWKMIQQTVQVAMKSARHLSFASVTEDGLPHVTPIGSLILRDDCTGYYFTICAAWIAIFLTATLPNI